MLQLTPKGKAGRENLLLKRSSFFLTAALIFFIPFQARLHFWPSYSYVLGIRSDYLAVKVSPFDIIIIFLFIYLIIFNSRELINIIRKNARFVLIFFLFLSLNLVFSINKINTLVKMIFLFEAYIFYYFVKQLKRKSPGFLFYPFLISLFLVNLLALLQFYKQSSIGGPFYFLGERSFDLSSPGISSAVLFGREFLRVYSTFSHPNSLAAYLGISLFLLIYFLKSQKYFVNKYIIYLLLIITFISFVITFSPGVFVSFIVALLITFSWVKKAVRKYLLFFLAIFVVLSILSQLSPILNKHKVLQIKSVSDRILLTKELFKKTNDWLFWGVGLGNSIYLTSKGSLSKDVFWTPQPVHSVYLIALAEVGIIPLLFLFFLFRKKILLENIMIFPLIFVMMTGSIDHYWLTLSQNSLILVFLLALL